MSGYALFAAVVRVTVSYVTSVKLVKDERRVVGMGGLRHFLMYGWASYETADFGAQLFYLDEHCLELSLSGTFQVIENFVKFGEE